MEAWMFGGKKKGLEDKIKLLFDGISEKNVKKVSKLLKENTSIVNSLDSEGKTPLHHACSIGDIAIVQLLIQNNAEVNVQDSRGWTPLHQAAYNGDENLLLLLLEQPNIKVALINKDKNTVLHYLARNPCQNEIGHVVDILFVKGSDVNAQNINGETPLHNACWKGHLQLVKLLLNNHANANMTNDHGETPLHWASRLGHTEIIKVLISNGADPAAVGQDGTPQDVANPEVAKIISECSSNPSSPSTERASVIPTPVIPVRTVDPIMVAHDSVDTWNITFFNTEGHSILLTDTNFMDQLHKNDKSEEPRSNAKLSNLVASYKPDLPYEFVVDLFAQIKSALNISEQDMFQYWIDNYNYRFEPIKNGKESTKNTEKPPVSNVSNPRRSIAITTAEAKKAIQNTIERFKPEKKQAVSRREIRSMQYSLFDQMTVVFGLSEESSDSESKDQSGTEATKPQKKKDIVWKKIKKMYKSDPATLELVRVDTQTSEQSYYKQISRKDAVRKEILETEKTYCDDLLVLIKVFLEPLLTAAIVSEKEHVSIFSNIKEIYELHCEFLKELESSQDWGPCFLRVAQFMHGYAIYCSNFLYSNETLKDCMRRKKFADFVLEGKNNPECKQLDLDSFLVKPMQRVCKYPLLLGELMRSLTPEDIEYDGLFQAFDAMKQAVSEVNEKKRATEEADNLLRKWNKVAENDRTLKASMSKHFALELLADVKSYARKPLPTPPQKKTPNP